MLSRKRTSLKPSLPKSSRKTAITLAAHAVSNASSRAIRKVERFFPKVPFRFTDLPPELRNRIYSYALVLDKPIEINPTRPDAPYTPKGEARARKLQRRHRKALTIGLILTCRLVSQEATAVLYRKNEFECNHRESWVLFERWLLQIGNTNVNHLTRTRVYWPSHCVNALDEKTFGSRYFVYLAPILRHALDGLPQSVIDERADNEAFQRTCKFLAKRGKLEITRLWSWRAKVQNGFNTITFFRAIIVPARNGSVKLSDLKTAVRNQGVILGDGSVEGPCQWAIQVERYKCLPRAGSIRDVVEVVNYYVPAAVSTLDRPRIQRSAS